METRWVLAVAVGVGGCLAAACGDDGDAGAAGNDGGSAGAAGATGGTEGNTGGSGGPSGGDGGGGAGASGGDSGAWIVNASVHGTALNDVYVAGYVSQSATGDYGFVKRFDGEQWETVYTASDYLSAVWAVSDSVVFAAGIAQLLHYDGGQWQVSIVEYDTVLFDVWANAADSAFAVGRLTVPSPTPEGVIYHFDGESWGVEVDGGVAELSGVWGASDNDVFAVGDAGTILHRDSAGWTSMQSGTTRELNAVWGTSPDDVFVVGGVDSGPGYVILHYDGAGWSTMETDDSRQSVLLDVWGTSSTDVYAVGAYRDAAQEPHAIVLHFDGAAWEELPAGIDQFLWSTWSGAPGDYYLTGPDDTLVHTTPG